MTCLKHTPLPWRLDHTPGMESPEGQYVPDDCEPYNLAQATIVAPTIDTGARTYNTKTKKWDIPVPQEITEIVFDDRPGKHNRSEEHLANAAFIVRACNAYNDLIEALEAAREHIDGEIDVIDGSYGEPAPNKAMQLARIIDAALAKAGVPNG